MEKRQQKTESFVRTYIIREKQERLLHELNHPAKRPRAIDRFSHTSSLLLKPSKIIMKDENLSHLTEFRQFMKQHDTDCLILSADSFLNEKTMRFSEAVQYASASGECAVIIGDTFACVYGEYTPNGRDEYLLCEETL
ncbi:MAG: hypothetical protein Q4C20_10350 [Erysipelotrichaceae bacterium]|nr:hypothetical protein [Erysipelotrichaceae bacterium]